MEKIGQCRVFANHYQFYLLDSNADPATDMPKWTDAATECGYVSNDQAIGVGTRAHLNDHWVELYFDDDAPDTSGYDRAFHVDLQIASGRLSVQGLADMEDEVYSVDVPNGKYRVHVLAANLGVDQFSTGEINEEDDQELTDDELAARKDLERYVIVLQRID